MQTPTNASAHKRYSLSLPLHLAARLEALCEMYPHKSRSDLVGDVLGLGLAEVERKWPRAVPGASLFHADSRQPIYLLTGPFAEFHGLARKLHSAMARDLARDEADLPFALDEYQLGHEE